MRSPVADRSRTDEARAQLVAAARRVVEEDVSSKLTLASVGRSIGASPRTLERAFAQQGTTLRAYVAEARLDRAAQLLRDDTLATIAEVARAVGFRQAPHFAKVFRRRYGLPPAEWRLHMHATSRPKPTERKSRQRARRGTESDVRVNEAIRRWVEERLAVDGAPVPTLD